MREIIETIERVVQSEFGLNEKVELERTDAKFGDFSTNVAMKLTKKLGKPPRDIAQTIVEALEDEKIKNAVVAGPGFINLTLTDQALLEMSTGEMAQPLAGKKILVEYSDPNPLKPLHAGHLYTTLVGDIIARLIENAGAETIRLNYGGDVGLHVGRAIWGIIEALGGEFPDKLIQIPEAERAKWLGECYVVGTMAYETDEEHKNEVIRRNRQIYEIHAENDHDSPLAQIYWTVRQWSYDYFAQLYQQLQVHEFDRFIPESSVTPLGIETVNAQLDKGVFEKSGDAVIFDGDKFGLHTRVFINSEGIPTYEAKDVGLSLTKWQDYQFDQSIIITAEEQKQYMQVVIKAIEQFAPEPALRTKHLTHGIVKLAGGVKMSSRKGNVVTALDILAAAREAGAASGTNPAEETILAAVKYAFAKVRLGSDIVYDPTESVALEGNSGPYLQYAHARARSILRKTQAPNSSQPKNPKSEILNSKQSQNNNDQKLKQKTTFQKDERTLVSKLSEYGEVVEKSSQELMPHYICTYLYELAQEFNRFYEKNRVIGDAREEIRLQLVSLYADKLKAGLELLGIKAPDKM